MDPLLEKLGAVERRSRELASEMAQPELAGDHLRLQELAKESASLEGLVGLYHRYKEILKHLEDNRALIQEEKETELRALIREDLESLEVRRDELESELRVALLPPDPNDDRNVIIEIRAGAGGEEAALFAAELVRVYSRYAQRKGWNAQVMATNTTGLGGIKEVSLEVQGKNAYSQLKYESGVHRVQRVPVTETNGRIHTSTATVAVLPEAEEVDVQISPDDLKIDTYRAGGHGGQNVQKLETAIRVTHLPTGLVVICQDERSQYQNRVKAMTVLRTRLYELERQRQQDSVSAQRRGLVGSGERSEKVRTYNFPQNRVTDHRIGLTLHSLSTVLDGDLSELLVALSAAEQAQKLEEALATG